MGSQGCAPAQGPILARFLLEGRATPLPLTHTKPAHMRILLSILALTAIVATASAQSETTDKRKARKAKKTEAVAAAPADQPKAACCSAKAGADKASCHAKGEMKSDAGTAPAGAAAEASPAEGAPKAACCAGKAKTACHDKAEAHGHQHEHGKAEEAPAAAPNK